jgi:galactokinase
MVWAERTVWAPGRVNLIGEHIDYHGLPVLPMALRRCVQVTYGPRADRRIVAESASYGRREFEWSEHLTPVAAGDWENYLRAAAQAIGGKWGVMRGVTATVTSDLPAAAGLSSSSALLVAFTLALLEANGRNTSFEELMEILPDGEQFVGTRGGGMDHAAALGSKAGCATLVEFAPVAVRHIPVPRDWAFLVAHSLQTAEKPARRARSTIYGARPATRRWRGWDCPRIATPWRTPKSSRRSSTPGRSATAFCTPPVRPCE